MRVCIEQTEDGMYSVEIEQEPMGALGGMGGDMESPDAETGEQAQTFASLDEAIEAARVAFGGEGGEGGETKPMIEGEDAFVAGYKRARGGEGQGF